MMTAAPNAAITPAAAPRSHDARVTASTTAAAIERAAATTGPIQFHAPP